MEEFYKQTKLTAGNRENLNRLIIKETDKRIYYVVTLPLPKQTRGQNVFMGECYQTFKGTVCV